MQTHSMTPMTAGADLNGIAIETKILELFAPASLPSIKSGFSYSTDNAALWRADAIHRAKNLTQMVIALADLAEAPSRCWLSSDLIAQTRCLARAYEALGVEDGDDELLPCAPLLTEVATRLTAIFGSARGIEAMVIADPVFFAADMRRALTLLCSEMIINALKYGYPHGTAGTIKVSLTNYGSAILLDVEDDGCGTVDSYTAGNGGGLLDRLGNVLGASLIRSTASAGHGYHVRALIRGDAAQMTCVQRDARMALV